MLSKSNSKLESFHKHSKLGIIGCGNIGGKQAANFIDNGYTVFVYDVNSDRLAEMQSIGAQVCHSSAEIATFSEVVFTCLPTPAIINKEVLEGEKCLSKGLKKGSIYVDISTNSPETVLKLHSAMKKLGVEMLDAPINSCPVGTKSLKGIGLSIMVGGSKKTFEQVRPILQLMADHVLYCGEISCGIQCKLIHNAVNAIAVQAVSEGITLALARGIDLQVIWDALRFGSFGQSAGDIHGLPHYWFSRRCDDPTQQIDFTTELLHKDVKLAFSMASEFNIPVPLMSLTIKDLEEAKQKGWSHHACTKVRCLQEERAGVIAKTSEVK